MTNFAIKFSNPWFLLFLIPAIALTFIPYFRSAKKYRRTRNRIVSMAVHMVFMVLCITVLAGITFEYDVPTVSEFAKRIKWAGGLLDICLAVQRYSDKSYWYFTKEEWDKMDEREKRNAFSMATGTYGIQDTGRMFDSSASLLVGGYYGGSSVHSTCQFDADNSDEEQQRRSNEEILQQLLTTQFVNTYVYEQSDGICKDDDGKIICDLNMICLDLHAQGQSEKSCSEDGFRKPFLPS